MKILYGVQGTGNGHITRARALSKHFKDFGMEVDYLFSGRDRSAYFDMGCFKDSATYYQGLSFNHHAGKISYVSTIRDNSIREFWQNVKDLNLSKYDVVMTDFEPITAWAARKQKVPSIGVGHQYAFNFNIPTSGNNVFAKYIMRYFAPVQHQIGLHWHHFNNPILPPIAEVHADDAPEEPNKILVYFGFEDTEQVINYLSPFKSHTFVVYGRFSHFQSFGNIQLKPLSREGFCYDLTTCTGVICNAGFELSSEAIQLGKKLLVKPLAGQMEQESNALALEQLGLGLSMNKLDPHTLGHWLEHFDGQRIVYPNVAREIVRWIAQGKWDQVAELSSRLWQETLMVPASKTREGFREIAA